MARPPRAASETPRQTTAAPLTDESSGAIAGRRLGALGLAPFILAGVVIWAGPGRIGAVALFAPLALLAYGATIASFLGGVRWGVELVRPGGPAARTLVASVAPQVAAWALLFAPIATELRFAGLFAVLALQGAADLPSPDLPRWYRRLRLPLTVGACAAMASGLLWALTLHRRG